MSTKVAVVAAATVRVESVVVFIVYMRFHQRWKKRKKAHECNILLYNLNLLLAHHHDLPLYFTLFLSLYFFLHFPLMILTKRAQTPVQKGLELGWSLFSLAWYHRNKCIVEFWHLGDIETERGRVGLGYCRLYRLSRVIFFGLPSSNLHGSVCCELGSKGLESRTTMQLPLPAPAAVPYGDPFLRKGA